MTIWEETQDERRYRWPPPPDAQPDVGDEGADRGGEQHDAALNASSRSLGMVYPGRPGDGGSAAREGLPVGQLSGPRVCGGVWPKATGQARWGTGVWMSAVRGAGAERGGPVRTVAASTAAPANAAAQIQLIWPKLDRNCAGSV